MKKKWLSLALAGALTLAGCADTNEITGKQYYVHTFGVDAYIVLFANYSNKRVEERVLSAVQGVSDLFSKIENSLSVSVPTSAIARFNEAKAGARVELDEISYTVLSMAKEMYDKTDGAYNPAVGLSVDLWGFTPRFYTFDYQPTKPYDREYHYGGDEEGAHSGFKTLPDEEYIEAFQKVSDFSKVKIGNDDGYYVVKPEDTVTVEGVEYTMQIDLGGIGKGYAADVGLEYLKKLGYDKGYVNVGSSSIALMKSNVADTDYTWNLGFTHPRSFGDYIKTPVKDVTLSSSGDYERYHVIDGVRYTHIIDPFTGAPIKSDLCMATVLGLPAAYADCLTTALLVKGYKEASTFLHEFYPEVKYSLVRERNGMLDVYTNLKDYTVLDILLTVHDYEG